MQRLLATTKANFLKSYLQSYEQLQPIKDSATINSWGQTFLNQNLYLSENQPCLLQSYIYCNLFKILGDKIFKSKSVFIWKSTWPFAIIYILQPVKDLSEQNCSNSTKSEGEGQSLSVLRFFEIVTCVYLKITTSGRHVFRRMFFLDPIFCSRDWNDTQNQFEMKIYLAG